MGEEFQGFAIHWENACGLLLGEECLVGSSVSEAMWQTWSYRTFSDAFLEVGRQVAREGGELGYDWSPFP